VIGEYLGNIALGYFLGSIPAGLVVGYLWLRRDIREAGSGKTGATNVLRTAGPVAALLVLVFDLGKGVAPALIGRFVFDDNGVAAAGAAAAVAGHVWPLFAGFRGGRGVATAFGALLGLTPLVALGVVVVAALVVAVTRTISVMSVVGGVVAAAAVGGLALAGELPAAYAYFTLAAVALIEFMHIPNIRRLLTGTEPRLGQGGDRPATG